MTARDGAVMTFREHLEELRSRLVKVALALALGFFTAWQFRVELFSMLSGPIGRALADNGIYHFQAIHVTESMMVYVKTALVGAVLVTSPFTFYQVWAFVSPGLLKKEKDFVLPVTFFTVLFFLIGAAFAYEVILPFLTDWFVKLTLEGDQVDMVVTLENAYSTAFLFLLLFGLVFEMPLVMFFLALFGMVTARGLLRFFRYFVVIAFIVGGILTPPDPFSQTMMAVPLCVLYAFGIAVAWGVERSRAKGDAGASHGVTLTRIFGASLVLLGLATALVLTLVRSLPEKDLTGLLPERATWMVGFNPSALASSPEIGSALRERGRGSVWVDALRSAGLAVEDVREAALVGAPEEARALLVRADGLGAKGAAVSAAFPSGGADSAGRLDDDTLAVGDTGMVRELEAVARGDAPALEAGEEDERLLDLARTSAPIWAWLPNPAASSGAWLGPGLAADLAAFGAWVLPGEETRVTLLAHARDRAVADQVESRLDALRNAASAGPAVEVEALAGAVRILAEEVERLAPDRRRAMDEVRTALERLTANPGPGDRGAAPFLVDLGRRISGWSLSRKDVRMSLTAEVDPGGLAPLLSPLLDAIR